MILATAGPAGSVAAALAFKFLRVTAAAMINPLHSILPFGLTAAFVTTTLGFAREAAAVSDLAFEVRPQGALVVPQGQRIEMEVIARNLGPDPATFVVFSTGEYPIFPIGGIRLFPAATQPSCDIQITDFIAPNGQITFRADYVLGSIPAGGESRCFLGVEGLWRQRSSYTLLMGAANGGPGASDPDFTNNVLNKTFLAQAPIALPLNAPALLGLMLGVVGVGLWHVRQRANG